MKTRLILPLFALALSASTSFAGIANVTVSPGSGSYNTLKEAFDAINAGSHTGTVTVSINASTTETASSVLNASGVGSASYASVSITPNGARSISGAIAAGSPLIDLNGADNVTFDGLNTGGNSLSIVNTTVSATAATSTIRLIGDASNNFITNCTIAGSETIATSGTIFFSTGTTTGNIGNTISNCTITQQSGNLPTNAIFSSGTSAAIFNSGTITGNNIQDYFSATLVSAGINLGATGNSAWTISNNKLFQTATRLYTTGSTHSGIFVGTGSGYTISGNTIGFANPSGTGQTVMVGNSVALSGTFPTAWNNTGTANATRYIAINCAFTAAGAASSIQNNTIGGFALYSSSGAATANGVWCGINVVSGNVNIGTVTGNTVGATTGQGSVYMATNSAGGAAVGIFVTSANTVSIQNNTLGAIDAAGAVVASGCGGINGIDVAGAGVFTISNNTLGNATADNLRAGNLATGTTLSNTGTFITTTGIGNAIGIRSAATGGPLNITGNTLRGFAMSSTVSSTSAVFAGITNTGAATTAINITGNFLGTSGLGLVRYANAIGLNSALTGINCSAGGAAVPFTISNNDIRGIVHTVAGANSHNYISWSHATSTTDNINNNTFTNLNVNTTGSIQFLAGGAANMTATGVENCNNNSISGTFSKGGSSGTDVINFYNRAGSSVTGAVQTQTGNNFSNVTVTTTTVIQGWLSQEGASASSGPSKTITGNTFSNIAGGSGGLTALQQTFAGPGTVNVSGNTISNITGTGAITGMSVGGASTGTQTYNTNSITSLVSSGAGGSVAGIAAAPNSGGGTATIGSNTINTLSSTGASSTVAGVALTAAATANITANTINALSGTGATAPVINGVSASSGTTITISKNKIYDLSGNQAATLVNGLNLTGGTTFAISNNLIGDLRATAATGLNAVNGINANAASTFSIFHNSIYLNATSSSVTTFGNSCITFLSTATTLNLRNNVLVNLSTPAQNGSNAAANGIAATLRRSTGTAATVPANYNVASNTNDFWVNPTAGTNNHETYVEGTSTITNAMNTFAQMKTFMVNRDQASFGEDINLPSPKFLSTTGSNANFLHVDTAIATQIESGGASGTGVTDDYDGDTRNVSTPDVGADEFNGIGIDLSPPNISYTLLGSGVQSSTRTFANVTITDATGVNAMAGTRPRVYYKKTGDANAFNDNTSGTAGWKYVEADGGGGSPFAFTLDYSLLSGGGGVVVSDVVQYFVVAQDTVTPNPNVAINLGVFNATPASVSLTAAAFPITGVINSYTIVPSISGTKTVGGGGDYADLNAAVNALNGAVITGPVTFFLIDSTYRGVDAVEAAPVIINANSGSSSTNTVTFKPASGQTPSISGTSAAALMTLNGADWVIIDGANTVGGVTRDLTITNTSTAATSAVIWLQNNGADGATNNVVKNVNVVGTSITGTDRTLFGVGSGSGTIGLTSFGTANNNNTIQNCNISKTQIGIYSGGASAVNKNTGTIISSNVMNAASPNNITTGGILANFENGPQINFNRINVLKHDGTTGTTTTAFGIALGVVPNNSIGATFAGNDVINAQMIGNEITGVTQLNSTGYSSFGIVVNTVTSGTTLLANNMVSGVRSPSTPTDMSAGILAGGGAGSTTQVYHNSVAMTGARGAASIPSYALAIGGSNPSVDVRNNIFSNTQTSSNAAGKSYAIGLAYGTPYGNLTSDYNDLITSGAQAAFAQTGGLGTTGTDRISLLAWQTQTTKDGNSISNAPGFVSLSDLHLSSNSSPAANACLPIAGITPDFDGNSRSATKPDIGADEIASNKLINLVPGVGMLNETFAPDTLSYTQDVSNSTSTITFTPTLLDSNATVTVNGGAVASGMASDPIALSAGMNTITVVVTPEFGPFRPADSPAAVAAANTYTVVVTRAAATYMVSYDGNGNTGGAAPIDANAYLAGATVTVLNQGSLVRTGYTFANWNTVADGSGTSYAPMATFTMPATNVTLFAQWTINTYTLTYSADANGSISGTSPQMVNHGASGTAVTAVPNAGYHFVDWSDASTDNPRTDTSVMGNISVMANFALNTYTLTYAAGSNGSITGTSPQMVNHGADGTPVTAVPDAGYHFVNWSDASVANPRTDTNVTGNISVTANFALNTYTLTYTAGPNGSISGVSPQTVNHGANGSAVTAVPNAGYNFVDWSDASTDNPRTDMNVMADISVTANFSGADVSVSGGNLFITDTTGANNDTLTISLNGANVRVNDPNRALVAGSGAMQVDANTIDVPLASISGNIQITTLGGNDTVTLSLAGGDFIPAGGLSYAGGNPTSGPGDKLVITGGSQGTVTYNYTNAHDGSVVMSNLGTVTYTGLEPITNSGTASDVVFNLPAGPNDATLADDGIGANGLSRLSGATIETTDFVNPTGSVTINRGNVADTLVVNALPDLNSSLTIGGAATQFSTLSFNGAITLASGQNLAGYATGTISLPNTTSDLATSGAGTISLTTARNLALTSGASLITVNGALTLNANQQVGATAGTFAGIDVNGATIQATGAGVVTVNGRGGSSGAGNPGVILRSGGLVKGGTTPGSITTDVFGTGGSGGSNPHGVDVEATGVISSFGGDVRVRGFAGTSTSANNYGVIPVNGGLITSTGNGNVLVQGTGGTNASGGNVGVIPHQGGTITSAGTGTVTVTGTGGNGGSSYGVQIFRDGRITSGGAGAVAVSGSGTFGVFVNGTDNNSPGARINSGGGSITVTGTLGGIALGGGGTNTISSVGNAPITLIGDSMVLDGTGINAVNSGTGSTTLRPLTNGRAIDLGGADSPTQLGLTDNELDRVTAGILNIGDANSGAVSVSAAVTRTTTTVLNITSSANIDVATGALGNTGGNVNLQPGTNVFPSNSGVDVTTSATSTLGITSGKDLKIVINSATVDSGYTQLNVMGLVNITGVNLALSGSHTPVGGEAYTIVKNDGADAIVGTFVGLPEGAILPNFFGSGFNARISYVDGDGNDAVIRVLPTISINNVTVSEGGGNAVFTVTQSGVSGVNTTFQYSTANGSAVAPGDYTAATAVIGTITAGNTSTTISVPVIDDVLYEAGDENFTVTLSNPVNANIVTATGTGTIQENEAVPTISIDSVSVSEAGGNAVFTVTQSTASVLNTTFTSSTADGTAVAPGDYTSATNVAGSITAGNTTTTISIPIIDNAVYETNETFTVTLASPANATIGTGTGTGTITNDDAAPVAQFNPTLYSVAENAGTVTLTIEKGGSTAVDAVVHYQTSNGSATAGSDYGASSGDVTFAPGETSKTISIPITDDAAYEVDENFTVILSVVSDVTIGAASTATVTILLNDTAPEITVEQPAGTDLANNGTVNFGTVNPNGDISRTFTIKNEGTADLTGLTITIDGTNPGDFTVTTDPTAPVVPGGDTLFIVKFAPTAAGNRSAQLHIANNDGDENPFDINLMGSRYTNLEAFRVQYFGNPADAGDGADANDYDSDGLTNVLEFATGSDPTVSNAAPGTLELVSGTMEFSYPRAVAAINDGFTFAVEFKDELSDPTWSTTGVTQQMIGGNSSIELWKASISQGANDARFLRLNVIAP